MTQLITQLQLRLNTIPPHQPLPQPLNDSFLRLIQSTLTAPAVPPPIRAPLLHLINSLDQRNLQLPVQLSIQLIQNYAQLNKSTVHNILQHNLDRNPQFIHLFRSSIHQLVHQLTQQPQAALSLSLITQAHPQLLEIFYQPSSSHPSDTPLVSIIKIVADGKDVLSTYTRKQLVFIILKVLKDGIIPRLKRATSAFDATDLVDQLSTILRSKSRPFLTDLCLNYPNFIDEIDHLIHHQSAKTSLQSSSNLSIKCKNQLDSFFKNPKEFIIFNIFDQFNSSSIPQNQRDSSRDEILNVLKNRKNIFDDHQMDVSLLSKGKSKLDEKAILNDKSHLTDTIKMKIKSRLEAIEMNPDEEDPEIPMIFDDNDEGSEDLDQDDEEERMRKMKQTIPIDIFADEDHLFFSNQNKQMGDSEGSNPEEEPEKEEEEKGKGLREGSRKTTTRQATTRQVNTSKDKQTNRKDKQEEKPRIDDRRKQARDRGEGGEENRSGNGAMGRPGNGASGGISRGQSRGGRGRGDIRGRGGGGGRGRGGSQAKTSDKLQENSPTAPKPDQEPTVESSTSRPINPPPYRGRGNAPSRGVRGGVDHQKKSHDRRVRGRDRKLAQISGGV